MNGVLMLPITNSDIINEQGVDELIQINIKDGVISSIQGGKSAEKLRKHLEKDMQAQIKNGNVFNVLRIAEVAFGANTKARSAVIDSGGLYSDPTIETAETEKRYGTMHLAFGDGKHGEEGSDGNYDAVSHYDFVIPQAGMTVELFKRDGDFKNLKNGEKFIDEGRLSY